MITADHVRLAQHLKFVSYYAGLNDIDLPVNELFIVFFLFSVLMAYSLNYCGQEFGNMDHIVSRIFEILLHAGKRANRTC